MAELVTTYNLLENADNPIAMDRGELKTDKQDKKIFLFLRGLPAAGKYTVAKELEKKFGWKIIWLHAIKNVIYDIVQEHDLSELMRQVMEPITIDVLRRGHSIIFVRPATESKTVHRMRTLVQKHSNHEFHLVTLVANRDELIKRAVARKDAYRINSKERMDEYFSRSGRIEPMEGELIIDTTKISLGQTVKKICTHFRYK